MADAVAELGRKKFLQTGPWGGKLTWKKSIDSTEDWLGLNPGLALFYGFLTVGSCDLHISFNRLGSTTEGT